MASSPKDKNQQYVETRKKIIGTFNEEDLFKFFKERLVGTAKEMGRGETVNFNEAARVVWKNIPLSALEGLIAAYKIKMARQATIDKANQELNKQCKCPSCRKKEENARKTAVKGEEAKKKNDGDSKEGKKPCGPGKGCGKKDGKKDPPNCGKKKKDENGKCKDNDGKCGEKKDCGNCADAKDNQRCGGKKDCGKCPDKKDGGKCSKKKDEGKCGKKKDEGKCADDEEVETARSNEKRKRLQSVERVPNKKTRKSRSSSTSSSDYDSYFS